MSDKISVMTIEMNGFPKDDGIIICEKCHKAHVAGQDTYLAIAGNIYLGNGGLVGNAMDEDWKVVRQFVFCRNGCAMDFLDKAVIQYLRNPGGSAYREG